MSMRLPNLKLPAVWYTRPFAQSSVEHPLQMKKHEEALKLLCAAQGINTGLLHDPNVMGASLARYALPIPEGDFPSASIPSLAAAIRVTKLNPSMQ